MRATVVVVIATLAFTTRAHAQSRDVAPPSLTVDEQWLLERGYIDDRDVSAGGATALVLGFGLGHILEGRWTHGGYLFTLGDTITFAMALYGFPALLRADADGFDRYAGLAVGGAIGFLVVRIWETRDAYNGPVEHNRKLSALRAHLGMSVLPHVIPYVSPNRDREGGGIAGLSLQF